MGNNSQIDQIAAAISEIHHGDPARAASQVEAFLQQTFIGYSPAQRIALLEKIAGKFGQGQQSMEAAPSAAEPGSEAFNNLLTMLLGKGILEKELSPEEMMKQLAAALNTVFDSVNKLIGGINATLMGGNSGEETIRMVISSCIDENEGIKSLEKYLDQIGEFFAIALRAYKEAAQTKIGEVLNELNPDRIAAENEGSMKFGPLRKAHLFDCYQDKYKTLRNWQSSGLLLEAFMKEFEKNCQKIYQKRE
ncbi:MAG: hypothetical protein HY885_01000 [Deltaproteobacteria bacterium]|nr:hypothetical protein [Deltaproteobacteria bacterium]